MISTPSTEELGAWLRLSLEPGLGPVQARTLLSGIGLPQDIYASSAATLERHTGPALARQLQRQPDDATASLIERTIEWANQPGHYVLTLADPAYPAALLDIHDPPLLLYVNGHPESLARPMLAIVGARSATAAGIDNAKAFAQYLAGQGWCIASGLASGIDTAAHHGALAGASGNCRTVAVLGTGIDLVYPSANRSLAHQIAAHGALVSEYPLGTRARRHQFPRRNRIIAGLAQGVLVVEAARQSGSLITAQMASEAGREVFAIPGSIHSPMARGCHALIRQGAKLVESGQDIQEELQKPEGHTTLPLSAALPSQYRQTISSAQQAASPAEASPRSAARPASEAPAAQPKQSLVNDLAAQQLLKQLSHDPTTPDVLASRCQMGIDTLNATLLQLELADYVERLADGRYQLR